MTRALALLVVLAGCKNLVGIEPYTSVDAASSDGRDGGSDCACPFGCGQGGTCTTAVVAGDHQTCALDAGQVYCWGQNTGVSGMGVSATPVAVPGLTSVRTLATSSTPDGQVAAFTAQLQDLTGPGLACAADDQGVRCWGDNNYGETGVNSPAAESVPVMVADTPAVDMLAAGGDHACARIGPVTAATLVCWGADMSGQLGDNMTSHEELCGPGQAYSCDTTPVQVGLTGSLVKQLGAGRSHTCALVDGGGTDYVYCWGAAAQGQIGDNSVATDEVIPTAVNDTSGTSGTMLAATSIAVGGDHACSLLGGQVSCWGLNTSGELGDGTMNQTAHPVIVLTLSDVTAIAAGEADTCAIAMGGQVWCWGANLAGTLGNTVANGSPVPVQVSGITDAIAITVGSAHACAVHATGAISCWGSNDDGELGDGLTTHSGIPPCVGVSDCSFTPVTVAMPAH